MAENSLRNTLVVNLFAGPGAGKTTCAWEIASKLKKLGYVTEYVSEYAKELVWDGRADLLDGSIDKQRAVYAEQKRRLQTEAESKLLDQSIKALLKENGIFYGSYKHHTIDLSIQNMQTTLRKLNSASFRGIASLEEQIAAAENVSAITECSRIPDCKFSNKEVAR